MADARKQYMENLRHAVTALRDAQARVDEHARFKNAYTDLGQVPWNVQVALSALRDAQESVVEAAIAFVEGAE